MMQNRQIHKSLTRWAIGGLNALDPLITAHSHLDSKVTLVYDLL